MIETTGEWHDDLIWCPSQCYLPIRVKGEDYTIYLRWRHSDPWTCDILKGSYPDIKEVFLFDLFSLYNVYFTSEDNLVEIKEKAIELTKMLFQKLENGECLKCDRPAEYSVPADWVGRCRYQLCAEHTAEYLLSVANRTIDRIRELEMYMRTTKEFLEAFTKVIRYDRKSD